ncbi:AsmA family protein [Flavihumibacter profundi]|uniref:AsmA family protein n=1 Tax=Flavihumibacter profundi TaxID=2716883 RepID=UPI001CC345FB|nr:AsmA-like C-terminal region-containing protein [Flavihumibacter profundi]MBZ5858275.1 AsmA-like C-terminal region-containing protein [Flavihumibacter profundi]
MKKVTLKILKFSGIFVASILALLFLLPILFPGTIAEKIKSWTNQSITGKLGFSKARLSFFEHFPSLTLTLHDFSLTGASPFEKDTLMAGKALSFGIDLGSVFQESIRVNKFYVDKASINIEVDEKGNANYNIYKSAVDSKRDSSGSSNTQLKIEGIYISDSKLVYNDRSIPMRIEADGFRYVGSGNLASAEFDLASHLEAKSLDFNYNGSTYLKKRKIDADLVTGINTSSLALKFEKNKILLNKLPIDFSGNMAILKDGYDIDLKLVSGTTDFANIFSILPPDYELWFADTRFKGTSRLTMDIKGAYKTAENLAPDLTVKLWVRDGQVIHKNAPAPLDHFNIAASVVLPKLNPDSLTLNIDTLGFDLDGKPTQATLMTKGISEPYIKADLKSQLDLALLDQAIGLSIAELKGQLDLQFQAEGKYATGQNPDNFRPDTIVTTIPSYQLRARINNGFFKHKDLPLAIEQISADIESRCANSEWKNITATINNVNAVIGKGFIKGDIRFKGIGPSDLQANLDASLHLDDLAKSIPMQGYSFGGNLRTNITAKGRLDNQRKLFPSINANIQLTNGKIQTPYYPEAIQNLQVMGKATSTKGSYQDLSVAIRQASFDFEGQPFLVIADLSNFNNLRYAITAKGILDLNRIYQVFAIKNYQVGGKIKADLTGKGTQSDAMAGRYANLQNRGTLEFENLELSAKEFPYPFTIPSGILEFNQDKAWLKNLVLRYHENEFTLDGYAQNILGYTLQNGILTGAMKLSSRKVMVDDFMVFAGTDTTTTTSPGGIILLPANLDLSLGADFREVYYGTTRLNDFSGQLALKNGNLRLTDTRFTIAGGTFSLGASYQPVDLRTANFSFTVKADSFDVKRAYKEIPLFREMASSASKAEGLISLDYGLEGRLNDQMKPVMPSIKGKGQLTLAQVKLNGLKLFSAVSKATGKDSLNNPGLKAVVIKSSVKNNIITIEKTKMKVFGFRPRIEGQTSLDGKLNLRFRLGLPPLGIVGIPMLVTGTAESPIVTMKKGTEKDELTEETDPGEQ